ncbi:uncharacterized protein KY384_007175 [Bacidia gigantensis]|uniref:uncharacterized protein n=1 Tax=Bacidia gigantensis TaxID=2732470 RepID=UPI001D055D9A|nr:uncharacterized protein KY384_007175 [Bacidia gigantensis]KAG8528258.1 hypothetical protein KY384_007175 [Bacidia gigantensis]
MTTQTQTQTTPHPTKVIATSAIPRGPVTSTLNFYQPPADGSRPYNYVEAPPEGQLPRNYSDTFVDVTINDVRGRETDFHIDVNAFAALKDVPESAEHDFQDDASIQAKYYPEVEKLLLDNAPGSKRILIFDHTVRRADPNAKRAPVTKVHIDQTTKSAEARVRFHLPNEAEELLKGRVRLINVWRPINGAVESSPLAFADSTSIPDDALVGIEHRYPDRTGETAAVKPTEGQRWHYWSGIDNNERILLQCYDSHGNHARVPHTAFVDPRSTAGRHCSSDELEG